MLTYKILCTNFETFNVGEYQSMYEGILAYLYANVINMIRGHRNNNFLNHVQNFKHFQHTETQDECLNLEEDKVQFVSYNLIFYEIKVTEKLSKRKKHG